jgi:hypothetical protein
MTAGRAAEKAAFLMRAGWAAAARAHLAGDASARSYERLQLGDRRAVLMDAPPGAGDDIGDFLRIAAYLAALGLSPPMVYDADETAGFALLEDLGDDLFTTVVARDPALEAPLCTAAAEVLLHLQSAAPPSALPDLSAGGWAESALLATEWYAGATAGNDALREALAGALAGLADGRRVLILRDFHAGNLLWLPGRTGLNRVGLLDFQQAQMGQPGYDLVSLLQDARRDVAPETEAAVLAVFARGLGIPVAEIRPAYAALGALRALRITGIFARLCLRDGKAGYLVHLPRVWAQLQGNLAHPALAGLRRVCDRLLPAPSDTIIGKLRAGCGSKAFR